MLNLKTIKPGKEGQQNLIKNIFNEMNKTEQTVYSQFTCVKTLKDAADEAAKSLSEQFVARAHKDHPAEAQAGTKFTHDGVDFRINRTPRYDFTLFAQWASLKAQVDEAAAAQKALKDQLSQLEKDILKANPQMQPVEVKETPVLLAR